MSPLARVTIGLVDLELAGEVAASELQDRARDGDGHREARDLDRFGIRPRGPVVLRSGENTNGSSGGRHDRPASSDRSGACAGRRAAVTPRIGTRTAFR